MIMKVSPVEAQTQKVLGFQLQMTHSWLAMTLIHAFCASGPLSSLEAVTPG